MKVRVTKVIGHYADADQKGTIHLMGAINTFACGFATEDYEYKSTTKPITCVTCLQYLAWAKRVSKIKAE